MTAELKCTDRRETIAALVLGELADTEAEEIRRHIEMCKTCEGFLEALTGQEEEIQTAFDLIARDAETIGSSVIDRVETNRRQPKARDTIRPPYLMKEVTKVIFQHKKLSTAAAAVLFAAIGLTAYLTIGTAQPAYALEQTADALKSVRYMHMKTRDDGNGLSDDRWIEIGPDGFQRRYRQESKSELLKIDILIVDDRKTVFEWWRNKNTLTLWNADQRQFTWTSNIWQYFRDLQQSSETVTVRENVDYRGRPAHLVRQLKLGQEIYIDPKTKLPIGIAKWEITYEDPPEGTFKIPDIPKGVTVVDKRSAPSATTKPVPAKPKPSEEDLTANMLFYTGRKALAEGKYELAVEHFNKFIELQPLQNWAHFWLGNAYRHLGKHERAIKEYEWVVNTFKNLGWPADYAHLARGLSYKQMKMEDKAKVDLGKALRVMIPSLRRPQGGFMFDYADDPLNRGKDLTDAQRVANMIVRLCEATGQNFGFNLKKSPKDNEEVIAAWENWWKEHAADYSVEPEKWTTP